MYVTTFYSYKGGVGRSMALVNVGALLARSGKRVLLVDFDLEAPGLTSYGPFRSAASHQGLVEYVHHFLDTDEAADVAEFIVPCQVDGAPIWLMPAGRHTEASYASEFSSINWKELYSEREGFLLFEDLRQQWASFDGRGFDYVLIDSRTGHTDIGGICTRQLPDAVVVMFLPTPQNIEGLRPIVRAVRKETAPVRRERVRLHFCPSNLPDLDDQELILKELLDKSREELDYENVAAEIYHYGSLDLLQQPIYSISNPKSRLASQYNELLTSIISHNLRDRDGALVALDRLRESFDVARRAGDQRQLQEIQGEAAVISAQFSDDVEIAWGLAGLAEKMSRPEDELKALNVVVEFGSSGRPFALLKRASVRASLDEREAAVDDLRQLLVEEKSTLFEIAPALELLGSLEPDHWRSIAEAGLENPLIDGFSKGQMLMMLLDGPDAIESVIKTARRLSPDQNGEGRGPHTALILALIAGGHFQEAMAAITTDRAMLFKSKVLPDLFNYSIAEWGASGAVPHDLFEQFIAVTEGMRRTNDPNGLQCFALAKGIIGRFDEALDDLRRADLAAKGTTSAFSCWRYFMASSEEFSEDLKEMRAIIESHQSFRPPGGVGGLKMSNAPRASA